MRWDNPTGRDEGLGDWLFCFVFWICIYRANTLVLNLFAMVQEDSGRGWEVKVFPSKAFSGCHHCEALSNKRVDLLGIVTNCEHLQHSTELMEDTKGIEVLTVTWLVQTYHRLWSMDNLLMHVLLCLEITTDHSCLFIIFYLNSI